MEWLTLIEVADRLGIHRRTVQRLVEKGDIKAYRFGNVWRVKESDLNEYIEQASNQ